MAHLRKDRRSPNWVIQFRWAGRPFSKSCKTTSKRMAEATQGRVEETLRLLGQGQIVMPHDADPGTWILSGGKAAQKPKAPVRSGTLATICDQYLEAQLGKADTTVGTERTHLRHLKRIPADTE